MEKDTPVTTLSLLRSTTTEDVKVKESFRKVRLSSFQDGRDKLLLAAAILGNFLSGAVYPVFLYLFGRMTDAAGTPDRYAYFSWMFLVAGIDFAVAFLGCACAEASAERQQRRMRLDFLHKIMEQEIGYFDAFDATTLATRLGLSCVQVRAAIGQKSGNFVMHMGFVVVSLGFAFWISWAMTLVSLTTVPFVIAAGLYTTYVEVRTTVRTKQSFEQASGVAQEAVSAIRTVKAFSMEGATNARFGQAIDLTFHTAKRGGHKVGLATGSHWFLMFLSFTVAYIYACYALANSRERGCLLWGAPDSNDGCFSAGDAIVTFWCVVGVGFFLGKAGPIYSARQRARVAMADVVDLYSRESQINPYKQEGVTSGSIQGQIDLRHVRFAYPTRPDRAIFRDLNLTIPAGKTTALVGGSGCGKSTIIQLLERFYDIEEGSITVDGTEVRDFHLGWYRNQISLVSQEPRLFSDTIYANILVGRPTATREEVIRAAKEANSYEFIVKFPQGFDTHVGEGGGQLSGGQKQRIAIARAILRDPKILILDEATSALDNESEKVVQHTLNELVTKGQRTTIIIAHRLSTIRQADKIVVLDNPNNEGAVVAEEGTHEELMKIPDGLYASLANAQIGVESSLPEAQALAVTAEIASMYSGDLSPRQASVVKLRSKFSSLRGSFAEVGGPYVIRESNSNPIVARRHYRRTIEPLKMHWPQLTLCLLGALINGLIWPLYALVWSYVVEVFMEFDPMVLRARARTWTWGFVGLGVAAFIGFYLQNSMVEHCGGVIVRAIRKRCFSAILRQDVEFFDNPANSPGSLLSLVSTDAIRLQKWGGDNLSVYVQSLAGIILGITLAMLADWRLGLVAFGSVLILVPVTYLQSTLQRTGGLQKKNKELPGTDVAVDTQQLLNEAILNIRTVTAYNMQDALGEKYKAVIEQEYLEGRRLAILSGVCWAVSQCLILFIITGNVYFGSWLIDNDDGGLNIRLMFQALFCLILAALNVGKALTSATGNAQARAAARKVYSVIDHRPIINDSSPDGMPVPNISSIRFDNVKFRYPIRPDVEIYRGVSFDVACGQSVALVGASGCGKSTCVQLVERFYDNTDGTIYLNEHDLHTYNIQSLRGKIGLVSQEPVLFYGTIEENIANGKPNCTAEEIQAAAKLANAHEFIMKLPDQYQTEVGRGGSTLSGGQKQRIAIARAVIRSPNLLILDEATSALDTESEKVVQEALNNLLATKQYTSIVIAHRLSTIRSADKIVVFINPDGHGARVAEVGNHEQLMKVPNGIYRGLVNIAEKRQV